MLTSRFNRRQCRHNFQPSKETGERRKSAISFCHTGDSILQEMLKVEVNIDLWQQNRSCPHSASVRQSCPFLLNSPSHDCKSLAVKSVYFLMWNTSRNFKDLDKMAALWRLFLFFFSQLLEKKIVWGLIKRFIWCYCEKPPAGIQKSHMEEISSSFKMTANIGLLLNDYS